jgi:hypothetical protein
VRSHTRDAPAPVALDDLPNHGQYNALENHTDKETTLYHPPLGKSIANHPHHAQTLIERTMTTMTNTNIHSPFRFLFCDAMLNVELHTKTTVAISPNVKEESIMPLLSDWESS